MQTKHMVMATVSLTGERLDTHALQLQLSLKTFGMMCVCIMIIHFNSPAVADGTSCQILCQT